MPKQRYCQTNGQPLIISILKKCVSKKCFTYHTLSIIPHQSKNTVKNITK